MAKFNLIFAFVPVLFIAALIFWESLASRVASLSSKVQQYQHLSRPSNTSSTSLQIIRHLAFLERIQNRESKLYSQNKEDGVIEYIFDNIGTTDKYYVEFGTENGNEINTRKLYEYYGWDGLLMDGIFYLI